LTHSAFVSSCAVPTEQHRIDRTGVAVKESTTETAVRIGWIDAAKGLGIVFVVVGHALGGLIDSRTALTMEPFRIGFLAIYTFHMPLFFLLSGLTVERRVARGARHFIQGLLPTVVWPYFLWSVLQLTVIYSIGSLANRPVENFLPGILSLPWKTVSQFWFLYALFWLHILATIALPRIGKEGFVLLALALKSIALIAPLPFPVRLVANHCFFYAVGVWLTLGGVDNLVSRHSPLIRAAILPALAVGLIVATVISAPQYAADIDVMRATSPEIANIAWRFPAMAAAIFSVVAVLGIATLTPVSTSSVLTFLGRRTMPIFLMHVLFVAGGRILLARAGFGEQPWLLLAILIGGGIVGPLVFDRIAAKFGLSRTLGFN
jgi:fucose 4-O-acetylase-like acetyltransferase